MTSNSKPSNVNLHIIGQRREKLENLFDDLDVYGQDLEGDTLDRVTKRIVNAFDSLGWSDNTVRYTLVNWLGHMLTFELTRQISAVMAAHYKELTIRAVNPFISEDQAVWSACVIRSIESQTHPQGPLRVITLYAHSGPLAGTAIVQKLLARSKSYRRLQAVCGVIKRGEKVSPESVMIGMRIYAELRMHDDLPRVARVQSSGTFDAYNREVTKQHTKARQRARASIE